MKVKRPPRYHPTGAGDRHVRRAESRRKKIRRADGRGERTDVAQKMEEHREDRAIASLLAGHIDDDAGMWGRASTPACAARHQSINLASLDIPGANVSSFANFHMHGCAYAHIPNPKDHYHDRGIAAQASADHVFAPPSQEGAHSQPPRSLHPRHLAHAPRIVYATLCGLETMRAGIANYVCRSAAEIRDEMSSIVLPIALSPTFLSSSLLCGPDYQLSISCDPSSELRARTLIRFTDRGTAPRTSPRHLCASLEA
ncbi:hypothetical protein HETIRDRAFT_100235 [Heterobasidion irregulare TC 32-1]|uniref:Uncharacterized protein n=1 Tax=Heterobasidion irregulare (strain TC 32-1) TaxID=747525 RepID=W4KKL2_HETIT|nr:uncharacterized protein HETIRDRAFT_100235 [Heterobasidion irregulare TC 32-1]ETW86254.1 hypothetical protein HETIRDRAFT_100235 [Heterobasidion irregulare TC 32-1]